MKRYDDFGQLLDYCRRSANPVGRLMLALIRVRDVRALSASDDICSALQLINFWQDAAVDASRGRVYVPQEDFRRLGLLDVNFPQHPSHRLLMQQQCERARDMMNSGTALLPYLAGRFRIEITLTIAGGLRILEKIAANGYDVRLRPVLRWYDLPRLTILAWTAWLAVHILALIDFRNRVFVMLSWAWSYLTLARGARLITRKVPPTLIRRDEADRDEPAAVSPPPPAPPA
jgi:phytoene/squalene synthetase